MRAAYWPYVLSAADASRPAAREPELQPPETVKKYVTQGHQVVVQVGAGVRESAGLGV
jgi:NAD/NADP transhydrogenase alpha subunit